ncbi:nucleotidyltransferase domain-containing protein [Streptacidiphilus sp. ASG 303]|uniref:aminoglycoside adenylyltransferase domain-containing protein n=1 Tax=Streptacidiphilus sp. ASG 303 TaxID=2896847 RepID=UPI001E611ECE|nr:nucleotidyltransferase domain-containing protein [Streptacidiphilus sp. ASG 303]MCD0483606.1 nucleotidyltransferase domain-containing protein [Streptacidiphilus sp. ASG 303]
MESQVDDAARSALDAYLSGLDRACPGLARGVHLTGSAALGDWIPDRSDLDILTVTDRPLAEDELDALAALHAAAAGPPHLDAVYLPLDAVGRRPAPGSPGFPHVVDGVLHRSGHHPDPVLWATLDRYGRTLRGRAAQDLGAAPDPHWLREWNLANLASYWRPLAADARPRLASRDPHAPIPADAVAWLVLGPGRLHHTVATGGVISKTAAADHTARLLPRYAALLSRARSWRLGDGTVAFTAADGLAACDLVKAVADHADRL